MQTVYVDLLFLINFSMDLLCLFLVSRLLSRRFSPFRAILAAVIGGAYSVAALFFPALPIPPLIPNALCCVVMCLTAFLKKGEGAGGFFAVIFTYLLASVLLGGIMTASFNLLNRADLKLDGIGDNDLPPWLVISVSLSSLLATFAGGRFLRRRAQRQTAQITVSFGGNEVSFGAMYDSGNLLRDRIGGRPVIVVDQRHAEGLLGNRNILNANALTELDAELAKRTALIPYRTASGCKTMVAIRPQRLIISSGGRAKEADALIGFADVKETLEGCSALVPYELI